MTQRSDNTWWDLRGAAGPWSAALGLLLAAAGAFAQTPPGPDPGAVIQLLATQPPVDTNSPTVATASFDPPIVRPGELSIYRVSVNALETVIKRIEPISIPRQLIMRATTQGQALPVQAGAIRPVTVFNYEARASEPGLIYVPPYELEVNGQPVLVPGAWLDVRDQLPPDHQPARRLVCEPSITNVYIGETFTVRVSLPGTRVNAIEGISPLQLNGDGFVWDRGVRATVEPVTMDGRNVPTLSYLTTARAVTSGELTMSAQGFTSGNEFGAPVIIRGQVTIPGAPSRRVLLDSEPVTVRVRPLPPNRPAGFTGSVGRFACDPPRLETNSVRTGDPVRLTVTVRSEDGAGGVVPPPPPQVPHWQVFPAVDAGRVAANPGIYPGTSFQFALIPLSPDVQSTPAIAFSSFDPQSENYVDLTIPPVPITVTGEALPDELADFAAQSGRTSAPKLTLSELATTPGRTVASLTPVQLRNWFPIVQILPVVAFVALWRYERHRRFLEAHPEIVRRRRARRTLRRLRRELKRAVAARDSDAFVQQAIASLQVACAPHGPAEPRALVSDDVQALLPVDRHEDALVVKRLFDSANATRFGGLVSASQDVFAHQPALDAVLDQLEERLCD